MNKYHLKVLGEETYNVNVFAEGFSYSEAGCYCFYERNDQGRLPIAYYPIAKTIIESIEYNIEI